MTDINADKAIQLAEDKAQKPRRRRESHGISSYLNTGKLPSGRAYRRAQKEIEEYRRQLFELYGGKEKCRPDVAVIIEQVTTSLTVSLLCQTWLKKAGIFRKDSLKRGDLELHSVLQKGYSTFASLATRQLETAARLAASKPLPDAGPSDLASYLKLKATETADGTIYEPPDAEAEGGQK